MTCPEIVLKAGTPAEHKMRRCLESLYRTYSLAGWTFTSRIEVDQHGWPHSHPVLTLNTASADEEIMALTELLHEQLHWFEEENQEQRDRAVEATRERYPTVPAERPDGAGDETSTRLHLLVCHLEHQAMRQLVGAPRAREVMERQSRHPYRWVYRTVLADEAALGALVRTHDLIPAPLRDVAC